MSKLFLDSLEIQNFRCFKHFSVEQLGRVNLIVGKNSVGKSSLLESLWLYSNRGSVRTIRDILITRNEFHRRVLRSSLSEMENNEEMLTSTISHLFFEHKSIENNPISITIGPIGSEADKLSLTSGWYVTQSDADDLPRLREVSLDDLETANERVLVLAVGRGTSPRSLYRVESILRGSTIRNESEPASSNLIRANGLNDALISKLWATVALTDLEEDVIGALRIIIPQVDRVAVLGESGDAIILVKLKDGENRIPLRTLGDGMNRVFGIALALVNSKNGILLVDEIENGLHYTVQLELWRLILKVARRLNIQVFATTHNWDCIEAFQKATMEDPELGMLIRLENKKGKVVPTLFDEQELAIATREDI